jgi:hypothetical protein
MPPYEVQRVVDFIHGTKKVVKEKTVRKKGVKAIASTAGSVAEGMKPPRVESLGLGKNIPGSMRTEVLRYLKEREADPQWFDAAAMTARSAFKRLYALLHIPPGSRAQAILFENNPPADSKLFAIKELTKATTPADQAKAIIDNKIPYRVASTVISAMTPTVLLALIEVMSPQELINNLGSLQKRGAMNNADLKALIEEKLVKAKTGKRVAALKGKEAAKVANLGADITAKLDQVADAQMKHRARITRPTALLVDKSGSMNVSIELGKQTAAMISAVMDAPLYVYAFDNIAYPITPGIPLGGKRLEMSDWERAFRGIAANGGTCCGIPLEHMMRANQSVEQIIIVTDGGEHNNPTFADAYLRYAAKFGRPNVCMVQAPGEPDSMTGRCKLAGIEVDVWDVRSDSSKTNYSLPGLLAFLNKPSKMDLLIEIMSCQLPQRKAA